MPKEQNEFGPSIYENVEGVAHNESDGSIHCHLCGYSRICRLGMEQMEFYLQRHMREYHGISLQFRIDADSRKVTLIPPL